MRKAAQQEMTGAGRRQILPAAGYTMVIAVLTAVLFDYYFDLNDDVLIKDIVAGVHTGTPSGYSIQMLYPISAFISFFYRIFRGADWYGLFLCGCQYLCIFLTARRSLAMLEWAEGKENAAAAGRKWKKGPALFVLLGFLTYGFFLYELVYVQYTVTCGILTATAAFLLYTTPQEYDAKRFWKENTVSILILIAAFSIRTEMFLLLLPFVGAAGLSKWLREGFRKQGRKYGVVIGMVLAGMSVMWLGDAAAHRSPEWQEFRRVFDARTQIYDFYGVPEYGEHKAFYDSIGLSQEEYALLKNYNYGVDDSIDADRLEEIEAYAKTVYRSARTTKERLQDALWNYRRRLTGVEGSPYNRLVIFAYLCVAAGLLCTGRPALLWQPCLLFAARSISWFYIEYRGRVVSRIAVPLYLMELLLLAGMFWQECVMSRRRNREEETAPGIRKEERDAVPMVSAKGKSLDWCVRVILLVLVFWGVSASLDNVWKVMQEQENREQINRPYQALQEYCKADPAHFYYVDVYSTVYFSEKMFEKVDNSGRNYDIIGGWACKSPLSGQEPLQFFMTDSRRSVDWLAAYLEQEKAGIPVKKDEIQTEGETVWEVYEIQSEIKAE